MTRVRSAPADAAFRAYDDMRVDRVFETLPPLTERQWARLAMLAADQAGLRLSDQYQLRDALDQALCP